MIPMDERGFLEPGVCTKVFHALRPDDHRVGRHIRFRLVRGDDEQTLRDFFNSPTYTPIPMCSGGLLDEASYSAAAQSIHSDRDEVYTLIGVDGPSSDEYVVVFGRLKSGEDGLLEFGLAVDERYSGRGIATYLLSLLEK